MKKLNISIAAVGLAVASLTLGACATPTAYGPAMSANDTGYSESQIATGTYRVGFRGNSLTDRATVEDYLMYRAAELTLQQGYDGFTVIRSDTDRDVQLRANPSFGAGYYGGFSPYWGYYGPRGYHRWSPYYGDPFFDRAVDYDQIERFEAYATIAMFNGTRSEPMSFDASDVVTTLRPRVKFPAER